MLNNFQNSFTVKLSSDCATNLPLKIPPHLKLSLHYLVKPLCSKIDLISMLINSSCRLSIMSL